MSTDLCISQVISRIAQNDSAEVDLVQLVTGEQAIRKSIKLDNKYITPRNITEVDVLTMLKNAPHISQLIGVCIDQPTVDNPRFQMILQAYQGDLIHYTQQLDVRKALQDMCIAMYICEQVNVVHYDIKPGNIFYQTDSQQTNFYLADFDLASIPESGSTVRGTRGYIAPELLLSGMNKLPFAHDIFSLAITLSNILARRMLLPKDIQTLRRLYINRPFEIDISYIRPKVDEQTYNILQSMCAFYPEERPTPQMILEIYNIPLPNLDFLFLAYPEIQVDQLVNKHTLVDAIASEIYHRLGKPLDKYFTARHLASLRLGEKVDLSTDGWTAVLTMFKDLDYRIYNPRLTSFLKQWFTPEN